MDSEVIAYDKLRHTLDTRLAGSVPRSHAAELSLSEFWRIVRRRKAIILLTLTATIALVAIVSAVLPRKYEAVGRLSMNFDSSNALGLEDFATLSGGLDSNAKLETQVRVLQSEKLAWEVIRSMRLNHHPAFAGKKLAAESHDGTSDADLEVRAELLRKFGKSLRVQSVPKTQIVEIRFRSTDRKLAADVVNTLADAYIEGNFRSKFEATVQASNWLATQLEELKAKVEAAQERMTAYQRDHGIIGSDETHNTVMSALDEVTKQLTAAEADRIVKEARYRMTDSANPELIASVVPNSVIQMLRAQEVDLSNQYTQATSKFGPSYPRVVQLHDQLDQVRGSITTEVINVRKRLENEYRAALDSERMIRQSVDRQKADAHRLNEDAIQFAILKREVEAGRDLYEGLQKKLKEAGVLAGLKSTNVTVVDSASRPLEPAEPRMFLNLTLAVLGGLLGGTVLAFVSENLDNTIRTPDEVETVTGLPSLATIPAVKQPAPTSSKLALPHLPMTITAPRSTFSEAFRALRTSLLLAFPGAPPKIIVVSSPLPSEGKSTVALNCAAVLAQHGRRVLLVDADLRRPTLHSKLGLKSIGGLTACLTGAEGPDSVAVAIPAINLTLIPSGSAPPNPADLLGSEQMRQLLERWKVEYDHVIIDTPPVLAVTDAVLMASQADVVMLVVRSAATKRNSLKRASELLRRASPRMAGTVTNALNVNSSDFEDYYGVYGSEYEKGYYHEAPTLSN